MKELKKLAEALGYEVIGESVDGEPVEIWVTHPDRGVETMQFEPLYNAEQCLEIMEHFKFDIVYWDKCKEAWEAEKEFDYERIINAYGKTIQEAVLNCALEIIK